MGLKHPVVYINERVCNIKSTHVRRRVTVEDVCTSLGELLVWIACPEDRKIVIFVIQPFLGFFFLEVKIKNKKIAEQQLTNNNTAAY